MTQPKQVTFIIILVAFAALLPLSVFSQNAVISLEDVPLYALPMVDEVPVAILKRGDTVTVIGQRGAWVKVKYGDLEEEKGWMQIQMKKQKPENKRELHGTKSVDTDAKAVPVSNVSKPELYAGPVPDRLKIDPPPAEPEIDGTVYRRFGYCFGMGVIQSDFTYNWKFLFHSSRRFALGGSFKHILGEAADSYLMMANFSYLLDVGKNMLPYVTAGTGFINTVPERSISLGSVSNMAVNYGFGIRRQFRKQLAFTFDASQYSVFTGKGTRHFREFMLGFLVGKFWD